MANTRETIVNKCFELVRDNTPTTVKVERDPIIAEELGKTAFPAVFFETTNEDIDRLTVGNLNAAELELAVIVLVGGANRDTQRNSVVTEIESVLMADRTLGGNVFDCRLTRVESVATGESAPYASCRMIFLIEYSYSV